MSIDIWLTTTLEKLIYAPIVYVSTVLFSVAWYNRKHFAVNYFGISLNYPQKTPALFYIVSPRFDQNLRCAVNSWTGFCSGGTTLLTQLSCNSIVRPDGQHPPPNALTEINYYPVSRFNIFRNVANRILVILTSLTRQDVSLVSSLLASELLSLVRNIPGQIF